MCSGHVDGSRCRLGPVGDHVGMTAPDMVASGLPPSIRVAPSLDMFGQAVAQPVYHWPQQLLHHERVERRPGLRPRPAGDRLGVRQRNLPVPAGERKDPGLSLVEPRSEQHLQLPLFAAELDATAKHLRNPAIVTAFRRIGLSEQAGTGMRAIYRNWQSLGHVPPVIENDKARKAFELRLLRQELRSP